MPQSEPKEPTACDRVLAHYRERVGGAWRPADDILFRAAWNEGAHERERQLLAEVEKLHDGAVSALKERNHSLDKLDAANALLVKSRNFFRTCAGCERHVEDIDAHLAGVRAPR